MKYKHHLIYITTNLLNNKKYTGKHLTNDLSDNYLGSGILLKKPLIKTENKLFLLKF